jgi:hypothetical protein
MDYMVIGTQYFLILSSFLHSEIFEDIKGQSCAR